MDKMNDLVDILSEEPGEKSYVRHSRQSSVVQPRDGTTKTKFTIGALNCITLAENKAENLVEVLRREQTTFVDDVIGLSETRINAFGKLVGRQQAGLQVGGSHLLFSSSLGSYNGTGFLVHYQWKDSILRFKPLSDRLSYLDMYVRGYHIRIISVYLPSDTANERHIMKRNQYKEMLLTEIPNLLNVTPTPYIIVGDFNARIGAFNTSDGVFLGMQALLSNFDLKQQQKNWPGEQLINFGKERRIYVANRFTLVSSELRYTCQGRRNDDDKKEIDYILTPVQPDTGSFSIKLDGFKLKPTSNEFPTDHRLIRYTFELSNFLEMNEQFKPTNDAMEICFVLEWTMVTKQSLICLLFKNVITKENGSEFLKNWSRDHHFMGVEVGTCTYSFYDDGNTIIVLTQTKRDARKVIDSFSSIDVTPLHITNFANLDASNLENFLLFHNELLSLDVDTYLNEPIESTKKKWNAILDHQRPINALVTESIKPDYFKYQTPLFKRIHFVQQQWLELSSTDKLWESTWEMYELSQVADLAINIDEKMFALLPILFRLEENIKHSRHLVLFEFKEGTDLANVELVVRRQFTVHQLRPRNPKIVIKRWSNNLIIFSKSKASIGKAVNSVAPHFLSSLFRVTISDDTYSSYQKNCEQLRSLGANFICEQNYVRCDSLILQLEKQNTKQSKRMHIFYSKIMSELFENNKEIINASEDKIGKYVDLVQRPLLEQILLVPLAPIQLAHITLDEQIILRKLLPNIEIPKDLTLFEEFRASYYRAKWRLVRDFRLAEHVKNLAEYVAGSIWMRDILWIGEHWIDIAKNKKSMGHCPGYLP